MEKSAATRMTSKGQVVIPRVMRAYLGWKPGTRLRVEAEGGAVTLRPLGSAPGESWLAEVAGCVAGGDPVADLEREHRLEVERDARLAWLQHAPADAAMMAAGRDGRDSDPA
jgi:AbrB family looped-hinge helix DNA binding protein